MLRHAAARWLPICRVVSIASSHPPTARNASRLLEAGQAFLEGASRGNYDIGTGQTRDATPDTGLGLATSHVRNGLPKHAAEFVHREHAGRESAPGTSLIRARGPASRTPLSASAFPRG